MSYLYRTRYRFEAAFYIMFTVICGWIAYFVTGGILDPGWGSIFVLTVTMFPLFAYIIGSIADLESVS